jgi:modulator of FtsH protease
MTRDRTHTLFGQTMGYVAVTAGCFALGSYLGRNLSQVWAIVWFIVAFACLIGMNFAVRRSGTLAVGLLLVFGAALGLAMAPTLVYYASTSPQALWQAGGATALFIAGFGAAGYATRRDLSGLARLCFWALVALIVLGIVMIFIRIPNGSLIYSVLGLLIFAGLTMVDFQRLRRSKDIGSAPLLAASIFLDALNVFLFFLRIFSRGD